MFFGLHDTAIGFLILTLEADVFPFYTERRAAQANEDLLEAHSAQDQSVPHATDSDRMRALRGGGIGTARLEGVGAFVSGGRKRKERPFLL